MVQRVVPELALSAPAAAARRCAVVRATALAAAVFEAAPSGELRGHKRKRSRATARVRRSV